MLTALLFLTLFYLGRPCGITFLIESLLVANSVLFSECLFILYTFWKFLLDVEVCVHIKLFFSKDVKDHPIVATEKSAMRHDYYFFEGSVSLNIFKVICFCSFTTLLGCTQCESLVICLACNLTSHLWFSIFHQFSDTPFHNETCPFPSPVFLEVWLSKC